MPTTAREAPNVMTAKKKPAAASAQRKRPKSSRARNPTPPAGSKQKRPLIVGIGASAGGLNAFELFFSKMLIYLDSELQKRLLRLFHYALRPGGILFLGTSENIGGYVDLFAERTKRWKIFKRTESMHAAVASLAFPFSPSHKETGEIGPRAQSTGSRDTRISGVAEKLLLDRYAPPCVLINKTGNIFYIHGPTSRCLALPQGEASLNILATARGGLKNALATLIRKASAQKRPAFLEDVQIRSNGKYQRLNLAATRYQDGHGAGELLLTTFEDAGPSKVKTKKEGRPRTV